MSMQNMTALEALGIDFMNDPEIESAYEACTTGADLAIEAFIGDYENEDAALEEDFDFSDLVEDSEAMESVGEAADAVKNFFVTIWRKFHQFFQWIVDIFKELARSIKAKLKTGAMAKMAAHGYATTDVTPYELRVISGKDIEKEPTDNSEKSAIVGVLDLGKKMNSLVADGKKIDYELRQAIADPNKMTKDAAKELSTNYKAKCKLVTAVCNRYLKDSRKDYGDVKRAARKIAMSAIPEGIHAASTAHRDFKDAARRNKESMRG